MERINDIISRAIEQPITPMNWQYTPKRDILANMTSPSKGQRMPFLTILLLAATMSWTGISLAADLPVGIFSAGDLNGWNDKGFKGKTKYSLITEDGKTVLKAESKKGASGLVKKVSVDSKKLPLLRWSWKISHSLKKEDIKSKKGDDFAARVYVVFPRTIFWKTRAINYVWANKMAKDSSAPNPYTSNALIVAVESGDDKTGNWVTEERNIYEDYKKLFGEEPPTLGAVAVMSDTDDTEDEVTAWYGDITLVEK